MATQTVKWGSLCVAFLLSAAPAVSDELNGKIAYISSPDGDQEIYVMNADGSNQTRLTFNPAADSGPAWSPDGLKIAFTSNRDGNEEIYVMNADGSGQTRLTQNAADDFSPAWSPDGQMIAFTSSRDGKGEIYVMNADGSNATNLTHHPAYDAEPAWSPDGTKIAFHSNRTPDNDIYVMNVDGTGVTQLTTHREHDHSADWSPDGSKIIFTSFRDSSSNAEIYVMNADGSGQNNLTRRNANDLSPCWSSDGTKIAFHSPRSGRHEVYVMNADGSGQTQLTNTGGGHADWQRIPPVIDVKIDIKPGERPNSINPRSLGRIAVALLTTESFDAATDADANTVRFGIVGTEAAPVHVALDDADMDGDIDLMLHFSTQETGIKCGNTAATLTGETFAGRKIRGTDAINTVGCK